MSRISMLDLRMMYIPSTKRHNKGSHHIVNIVPDFVNFLGLGRRTTSGWCREVDFHLRELPIEVSQVLLKASHFLKNHQVKNLKKRKIWMFLMLVSRFSMRKVLLMNSDIFMTVYKKVAFLFLSLFSVWGYKVHSLIVYYIMFWLTYACFIY